MTTIPRLLVAGNWKMHGLKSALAEISAICAVVNEGAASTSDLVICPPATLIAAAAACCARTRVAIGGQSCHEKSFGAHTGDISAEMLRDGGASFVIVGHSERRADHGETDATTRAKAVAAIRAGLIPIVCIGETKTERDDGRASRFSVSRSSTQFHRRPTPPKSSSPTNQSGLLAPASRPRSATSPKRMPSSAPISKSSWRGEGLPYASFMGDP